MFELHITSEITNCFANVKQLKKNGFHIFYHMQRIVGIFARNRSDLAVNCRVIIHCLEVSCKEDKVTSADLFRF